jgi:tripartite-type tricarboxylate transporter receptor subunit TctC
MKLPRRKFLHLAVGAAALPTVSRFAWAQTYPVRPITMVIPFAAGGPLDTVGRILADRLRGALGQSVIIENVPGASGSIGVGRVARAAPDGYTLSLGQWGTHVVNGAMYTLPYDLIRDFEPISLLTSNPALIVAKKPMPADDLKGLIAWLRANPGKASLGTTGVGGPSHVNGVFFQNLTGTRFAFVPYRGLGPAMQDLIAGQIDMVIDPPVNSLPQVRAGRIKAYAVTAKSRLAAAPDIPTVDEAGLPGFHTLTWFGLWAPARTPTEVVARLNAAVVETLTDPAVRGRLGDLGQDIFPREQQNPEALAAFHKAEIEKWWPIIKAANIKAE